MDTPGGPAGRRGRWHEYLSKFDLHVTCVPGHCNTVADALSRWENPASEAYSEVSFQGTSTDKAEVIEFDKEEPALIKKHCLQCSIKIERKSRWSDARRFPRQIRQEGFILTLSRRCRS